MSQETTTIITAIRGVLDEALAAGRRTTADGKAIDEHQVHAERLAYAATEAAAAEALAAFAGEAAVRLRAQLEAHRDDFSVADGTVGRTLGAPEVVAAVRAAQHESRWREIG